MEAGELRERFGVLGARRCAGELGERPTTRAYSPTLFLPSALLCKGIGFRIKTTTNSTNERSSRALSPRKQHHNHHHQQLQQQARQTPQRNLLKILSYFVEGWRDTAAFQATADTEHDTMREIRCCLNSEQCDLSKKKQESVDCTQYITETSNERALLGAELFVVRSFL